MAIEDASLHQITSSNLAACAYDVESKILRIVFKNGSIYDYAGVPRATYDGLKTAESAGKYFHANVRDVYTFTKR